MKIRAAAILLSTLVAAAPAFAAAPATKPAPKPATTADPLKWDPLKDHTKPTDWYVVSIDNVQYAAFQPSKDQLSNPAFKSSEKPVKGKPRKYLNAFPLFKMTVVPSQADPNSVSITLETSNYRLEKGNIAAGGSWNVVCAVKADNCPPSNWTMPQTLKSDDSALPAAARSNAALAVHVYPPGTAPAGVTAPGGADKTTPADTTPALGVWEQAAFIEGSIGSPAKSATFKTNAEKREALKRALQTYTTSLASADPKKLTPSESTFLKTRFPGGAATPNFFDGEPARWRAMIAQEVAGYLDAKNATPDKYVPATDPAKMLNGAQPASSDLEKQLAKIYPDDTRMAGAKRAVIAAWLQSKKGNKDIDAATARLMKANGADKAMFDDLWAKATANGHLELALNGKDPAGLGKLVDRNTLLDAYCKPNAGNAGVAPAKTASPTRQLANQAADSGAAATGNGDATGGATLDNSRGATATNADPLANECSARLGLLSNQVAALQPRATGGNYALNTNVPSPAGGTANLNDGGGPGKFTPSGDNQYGDNKQDDPNAGKDSKMGDHMRSGATVGSFLGLLGLVCGGPIGLLVLGGAGFAIGFGVDKLTNKADS